MGRSGVIAGGMSVAMALTFAVTGSSSAMASTRTAATLTAASSPSGTVDFMIPDTTPSRYIEQDGPDFAAALKKLAPGVTVKLVNAAGDQTTQQSQAEAAISAGAKALVVVAADPPLSGGLLAYAHKHNVPVIGYENVPEDGPMYAQVEFNPEQAGALQGKYFAHEVTSGALGKTPVKLVRLYGNDGDVYDTQMLIGQNKYLNPLIKSGKVDVVCQSYTPNWAESAYVTEMAQCLSKTSNGVRAVLGVDDDSEEGSIASIQAAHLTAGSGPKDIAVFGGQNPTVVGLDQMLMGEQEDDVIKPFLFEADAAAKLTVAALKGEPAPKSLVNATVNAGNNNEVPTDLIGEDYVSGSNVAAQINKTVVLTKTFTWAQICVGAVTSTSGCKTYNKG